MNISYNWLKKYLNISHSPEELSEILTSIGLEVEGIEKFTSIPGGLVGLVTGRVLECSAHPNADKLSVTVVDVGGENPLDIVCGAPNVARGQTVVVAPVGSTIYPTKGEPFQIGKVKIRGRRSEGMICAEDEIGLGDDHDGIMVLSEDFDPGTPIDQIFPVEKDVIFDIGLTPNRSDATSHMGVARDLLAYLRVHSDYQEDLKWPDLRAFKESKANSEFDIKIEDIEACPRYSGLIIEGVEVKESPEWLKNKLKSVGLKPLNNIVDITNFVLLEYGQPLHAFDLNAIGGGGIRIKQLPTGTKFTTLDEVERELHSEDLMICDANDRPLCMAGVFGGLKSGVSKKTTYVFLESAHFEALTIRKTSTRHLLRTEAAKIYEKGSDPALTLPALKRAALLIEEMAGGKPASPVFDHYPNPIRSQEINLVYERVRKLTGAALSKEQITVILKAMDMEIVETGPEAILVRVPTNKADVKREADLIEEILRIYGFDKIPMGKHIQIPLISSSYPDKFTLTNRIADHLCSKGLSQMMNLSLSRSSYYQEAREDLVYVQNTSNEQLNIMRPDMVRSTVEAMVHNVNRRQNDLAFFEFGKTYRIEKGEIVERELLIMALTGQWENGNWTNEAKDSDFYILKGLVQSIFHKLGIYNIEETELDNDLMDYGIVCRRANRNLATAGKINGVLCSEMELDQDLFYAEFDWPALLKVAAKQQVVSQPVNKYPSTERDLALVVDRGCKFADLEELIVKNSGKYLDSVELFDVYEDEEKLGNNKKSYAVNLVFSAPDKTLTDKQINKMIKKVLGALKHHLQVELR